MAGLGRQHNRITGHCIVSLPVSRSAARTSSRLQGILKGCGACAAAGWAPGAGAGGSGGWECAAWRLAGPAGGSWRCRATLPMRNEGSDHPSAVPSNPSGHLLRPQRRAEAAASLPGQSGAARCKRRRPQRRLSQPYCPATAAAAAGAWFGVVRVIVQQGNGFRSPRRALVFGQLAACCAAARRPRGAGAGFPSSPFEVPPNHPELPGKHSAACCFLAIHAARLWCTMHPPAKKRRRCLNLARCGCARHVCGGLAAKHAWMFAQT